MNGRARLARGTAALTLALLAGVVAGRGWTLAGDHDVDLGRWFSDWARSAGFGGTAAIAAASIAYLAARQGARRQERADRKVQWWARAQWALDLTMQDDERAQEVGFGMLAALADSEWAGEHEADVIAAATVPAIAGGPVGDPSADGGRSAPVGRDRPGSVDASHSVEEVLP